MVVLTLTSSDLIGLPKRSMAPSATITMLDLVIHAATENIGLAAQSADTSDLW